MVTLRDALPIERIGLNDVGARSQVLLMDLGDQVWLRYVQQVVIVLHKLATLAEL